MTWNEVVGESPFREIALTGFTNLAFLLLKQDTKSIHTIPIHISHIPHPRPDLSHQPIPKAPIL